MLKISNLKKEFDNKTIVNIDNLEVGRGELFCFLGTNGAGKTTTIKMITGLLKPTSGNIYIDGLDIEQNSVEVKKKMAYVADFPILYKKITGREFIRFVANMYGVLSDLHLEKKIDDLLNLFNLNDNADQYIESYSKGMKQKVQIISALVHDPEIILFDEPFNGLDAEGIIALKDIMVSEAKKGKLIFLSTHILDIVESICSKVAILSKGSIKYIGNLEDEENNFKEKFIELTKER
ncbi:ABC transporter ATP-binding protein [Bacillus paramycoides]|uniref:ABC transporter ATP-binding protein n=1 Tax=Bacillus paramycoides TaxID=2026194 RepID=UPI002E21D435|nr:ABC transporter ATP-binding protein [Bacillus paramycoides]